MEEGKEKERKAGENEREEESGVKVQLWGVSSTMIG